MAMRRPRFKPTAILKPRRGPAGTGTLNDSTNTTTANEKVKSSTKCEITTVHQGKNDEQNLDQIFASNSIKEEKITVKKIDENEQNQNSESNSYLFLDDSASMPSPKNPSSTLSSNRSKTPQIIPTPIEIVKPLANEERIYEQPTPSPVKIIGDLPPPSPSTESKSKDDFDYFKSPFMSPSMQNSQQKSWSQSSRDASGYNEDMPLSPAKVRQRIRPTPCFGIRRNSLQGNISESDDDTNKRQRHLSTSSTVSNLNPNSNLSRAIVHNLNSRNRTESNCSNISDINLVREASMKLKQSYRTDGYKKVSNARRELNNRFNGKIPDKSHLKMFDLIYYNPVTNPMKNPATKQNNETPERRSSTSSNTSTVTNCEKTLKQELEPIAEVETAAPVPQLKLGANGEIILDEQSLVIETTRRKEAREALANSSLVYDDEFSGSGGFYKRSKRCRDWPPEETIKFYRSLHTIGTDFSLMLQLFPNRTRRDLKLKFKREERLNMNLVNKALLYPKQFNIDELKAEFETEEKELERLKAEWKELKVVRAKEKKENLMASTRKTKKRSASAAVRVLADGCSITQYEFTKPPRRRKASSEKTLNDETCTNQSQLINETKPNYKEINQQKKKKMLEQIDANLSQCSSTNNDTIDSSIEKQHSNNLIDDKSKSGNVEDFTNIPQKIKLQERRISIREDIQQNSLFNNIRNLNEHSAENNIELITENDLYEMNLIRDDDSIIQEYMDKSMTATSMDILNMDIIFHDSKTNQTNLSDSNNCGNDRNVSYKNESNIENNENNEIVKNNFDENQLIIYEKTNHDQYNDPHEITNENNCNHQVNTDIDINNDSACVDIPKTAMLKNDNSEINQNKHHETEVINMIEQQIIDNYYDTNKNDDNCYDLRTCDNKKMLAVNNDAEKLKENGFSNKRKIHNNVINYDNDNDDNDDNNDNNNDNDKEIDNVDGDNSDYDESEDDETINDLKNLRDSLVVVASQDPNDLKKVIHEVFLISPITGKLSDEPLDLPPDVIERIVSSLRPEP